MIKQKFFGTMSLDGARISQKKHKTLEEAIRRAEFLSRENDDQYFVLKIESVGWTEVLQTPVVYTEHEV